MQKTVLLSDVGGTNIRFALWENGVMTSIVSYKRMDFSDLQTAVETYLKSVNALPIQMIFGVAGTVENNRAVLTNGNWIIDAAFLQEKFKCESVLLVNDFVLQGLGTLGLNNSDLLLLGDKKEIGDGFRVVLGPGTGLGVCFITHNGKTGYTVLSSEGGHSTIAAITMAQQEMIRLLEQKWEHVSFERLVSGSGLCLIYEALFEMNKKFGEDVFWCQEVTSMQQKFSSVVDIYPTKFKEKCANAEDITVSASLGDTQALLAFWFFFQFLGIFAANMALILKTDTGVFLVGDLLRHSFVKQLLENSYFRLYFEKKGRFSSYLKRVPVFLVLKENIPFLGLSYLATQKNK